MYIYFVERLHHSKFQVNSTPPHMYCWNSKFHYVHLFEPSSCYLQAAASSRCTSSYDSEDQQRQASLLVSCMQFFFTDYKKHHLFRNRDSTKVTHLKINNTWSLEHNESWNAWGHWSCISETISQWSFELWIYREQQAQAIHKNHDIQGRTNVKFVPWVTFFPKLCTERWT